MTVLWITNIIFPEALSLLTGNHVNAYGGGWLLGAAERLVENGNIHLFVSTVSNCVNELKCIKGKHITHYIIPIGKGNISYNKNYEPYWKEIRNQVKPDVVHIHGTEFTHGLSYVKAIGNKNVVVSIQGMKSVIAEYYTAGISLKTILNNITIHDILKGGIYSETRAFKKCGQYEKELIRSVHCIIGRTTWDKAHSYTINPLRKYFICNETLQPTFYSGELWSQTTCIKHSIFLSQAYYPIKGLHIALRAISLLQNRYPDISLRIAGDDITSYKGLNGLKHNTTYWNYVKKLIERYNLKHKVTFTGLLSPNSMKSEYLRANVFICPSSIENSPNSLGEAQILGVPCIASYAGGIPDLMKGDEEHLYRFEDYEMLAHKISELFECEEYNKKMIKNALERHDPKANNSQLISIYKSILENGNSCNM